MGDPPGQQQQERSGALPLKLLSRAPRESGSAGAMGAGAWLGPQGGAGAGAAGGPVASRRERLVRREASMQRLWLLNELVDDGEAPKWSNHRRLARVKSSSFPHAPAETFHLAMSLVMQDRSQLPYSPSSSLHRVAIKLPNCEPSDMPDGWDHPFLLLCAHLGMQLRGSYVRSGCVQLLLELWHQQGVSNDDALALLSQLAPEHWLRLLGQDSLLANQRVQLQITTLGAPSAADPDHLSASAPQITPMAGPLPASSSSSFPLLPSALSHTPPAPPFSGAAASNTSVEGVGPNGVWGGQSRSQPLHATPPRNASRNQILEALVFGHGGDADHASGWSLSQPIGALQEEWRLGGSSGAVGAHSSPSRDPSYLARYMGVAVGVPGEGASRAPSRQPSSRLSLATGLAQQPSEGAMLASALDRTLAGTQPSSPALAGLGAAELSFASSPAAPAVDHASASLPAPAVGPLRRRHPSRHHSRLESRTHHASAPLAPLPSSTASTPALPSTPPSSAWAVSFGPDAAGPPTAQPHAGAGAAPDLVCVMPICVLLPQQPAGSQAAPAARLLLHAAGRNLQQPSPDAGPTRCWVRYKGQYLQCKASVYSDMLPAQHLPSILPQAAVAVCDLMRVEVSPPMLAGNGAAWTPGLMQIECQHGHNLLGAPKPVLLVSDPGVHAELTSLWPRLLQPGADLAQLDGLISDLGLWVEALQMLQGLASQAAGNHVQYSAGPGFVNGPVVPAATGASGGPGGAGLLCSHAAPTARRLSVSEGGQRPAAGWLGASAEVQAARALAVRGGCKLLLFAVSQGWTSTASMLISGLVETLGCSLQQLNAQAMMQENLDLLHMAVRSHRLELVTALLQLGARYGHAWDPASQGMAGLTPLHLAAVLPDAGAVAELLLLQLPGAPLAWFMATTRDGSTPQSMCLTMGNSRPGRMAELLMRRPEAAIVARPAAPMGLAGAGAEPAAAPQAAAEEAEAAGLEAEAEGEPGPDLRLRQRLSRSLSDPAHLDQGHPPAALTQAGHSSHGVGGGAACAGDAATRQAHQALASTQPTISLLYDRNTASSEDRRSQDDDCDYGLLLGAAFGSAVENFLAAKQRASHEAPEVARGALPAPAASSSLTPPTAGPGNAATAPSADSPPPITRAKSKSEEEPPGGGWRAERRRSGGAGTRAAVAKQQLLLAGGGGGAAGQHPAAPATAAAPLVALAPTCDSPTAVLRTSGPKQATGPDGGQASAAVAAAASAGDDHVVDPASHAPVDLQPAPEEKQQQRRLCRALRGDVHAAFGDVLRADLAVALLYACLTCWQFQLESWRATASLFLHSLWLPPLLLSILFSPSRRHGHRGVLAATAELAKLPSVALWLPAFATQLRCNAAACFALLLLSAIEASWTLTQHGLQPMRGSALWGLRSVRALHHAQQFLHLLTLAASAAGLPSCGAWPRALPAALAAFAAAHGAVAVGRQALRQRTGTTD